MKEEYHTKFATILQIIYQWEMLACFSNHIAIAFNLANKGKKVSVPLCWHKCQQNWPNGQSTKNIL
jgi:hypothetical protein